MQQVKQEQFGRETAELLSIGSVGKLGIQPYPPVEGLTVERCVLWTDRAHVWRLGCESLAAAMRNLVFRDIDVVHYSDK